MEQNYNEAEESENEEELEEIRLKGDYNQ